MLFTYANILFTHSSNIPFLTFLRIFISELKHAMTISEIKKHLGRFTVGIAGAGGLGSNCAALLARSGIGTLIIADFDKVEECNLSRQYYFTDQVGMEKTRAIKENILKMDPRINVLIHQEILTKENIPVLFRDCEIIVEAFDKPEMKEMIIETVQQKMPGTTLIVGSGMAGWGGNNLLRSRKIDDHLYVCGDESTDVSGNNPPMAPRVVIVAAMQANIVIEILMHRK